MEFDSFVLAAATADLNEEPAARPHADAVEFRMDMAADPATQLAAYDGDLPLIATNRATWEGGEADGDDRLDALARAAEYDFVEAVDVELRALRPGVAEDDDANPGETDVAAAAAADAEAAAETAAHARDHGAAVLASVHDFEATPDAERLDALLDAAVDAGDVGKLAVTARDRDDTLALLSATRKWTARGERVATMSMGEPGRHTRAVAPVYGSRIGYAPVDPERATAPGQYDLATLASLVERLG